MINNTYFIPCFSKTHCTPGKYLKNMVTKLPKSCKTNAICLMQIFNVKVQAAGKLINGIASPALNPTGTREM